MRTAVIPSGASLPTLYRSLAGDYPKFFKMDTACRLGFLLAEMLAKEDTDRFTPRTDRAILFFSHEGSQLTDRNYAETIKDFPSPAIFVYTIPNTVTGEIAIRNKWAGETGAYVLPEFDGVRILELIREAFQDGETSSVMAAWADCRSDEDWTAKAWLIDRNEIEQIKELSL